MYGCFLLIGKHQGQGGVVPCKYLGLYCVSFEWKETAMNKLPVVVIFCFTVIGHSLTIAQGLSMSQQNDMRRIIQSEQQNQRNREANRENSAQQKKDLGALTPEQLKNMESELADTPIKHGWDTPAALKQREIRSKYQARAQQNAYQNEQQAKSPRGPSAQGSTVYVAERPSQGVIPSSEEVEAMRMDRERKAAMLQKNKESVSGSPGCVIKPVMTNADMAACK